MNHIKGSGHNHKTSHCRDVLMNMPILMLVGILVMLFVVNKTILTTVVQGIWTNMQLCLRISKG